MFPADSDEAPLAVAGYLHSSSRLMMYCTARGMLVDAVLGFSLRASLCHDVILISNSTPRIDHRFQRRLILSKTGWWFIFRVRFILIHVTKLDQAEGVRA